MLMASTSLAGRGSGRRTVNITWARGKAVAAGPVGGLGLVGLAVGKVGHFKSEIAQAWLLKARIITNNRVRRGKTECDFIHSPRCFMLRCALGALAHQPDPFDMWRHALAGRVTVGTSLIMLHGCVRLRRVSLSPGVGDITQADTNKV